MTAGAFSRSGTVSVTTICAMSSQRSSRSNAGGENRPWVAAAYTLVAPSSRTFFAPSTRVPAVSIMSSIMIATLPCTSPISMVISTSLCSGRCLVRTASDAPSFSAKLLASFTRPASGDTTTRRSPLIDGRSWKYWVRIGTAVMWSTGMLKKPCTWPAWRSIVRTRSTPTASRISATILAVIGSRGADFLSWREYPYQGITAMIRRAEASFAALIMMSSSNRLSLTDWRTPLNTLQVDCTRNTSAPRMLSANRP